MKLKEGPKAHKDHLEKPESNQELDFLRKFFREAVYSAVTSRHSFPCDPESFSSSGFYKLLQRNFKPDELEPLEVFQRELSHNSDPNPKVNFICVVFPTTDDKAVSGSYGSVQNNIFAMRFTVTEAEFPGFPYSPKQDERGYTGLRGYRGTGISRKTDSLLLEEAKKIAQQQYEKGLTNDPEIKVLIGECVVRSEAYWNGHEIEKGNGMRRLYHPDSGQQMYYRLPPLKWNKDGTPVSYEAVEENLQIAMKGFPERIPVVKLAEILRTWWEAWYIRPKEMFDDEAAWERHKSFVMKILEEEILAPIQKYEFLNLVSRDEREQGKQLKNQFGLNAFVYIS